MTELRRRQAWGDEAPIGVVVNGHREGALLGRTLDSLARARRYASERGCSVDIQLVLDRADDATIEVARGMEALLAGYTEVDFGNLGAARQAGLARASNEWIAFLDGDDLISSNWLYDAYRAACEAHRPLDTVFHTELFVGFGAEVFFRRAVRSTDPEFDPLCLIADWFFCNNLFAHRSVFERCAIEQYDHEKGLGAEDWHWSCQTLAQGFVRDFVPGTAYFYRVKPPALSLGMTSGLIHKTSRLYEPPTVKALSKGVGARGAAENPRVTPQPEAPHLRRVVPDWVAEQAIDQAQVEAQLVQVARVARTGGPRADTFPPRTHYGAAEFYRRAAPRLADPRPKVALFWGENHRMGGSYLIERMIEAVVKSFPGRQVVVLSEADTLMGEVMETRFAADGITVLDFAAARQQFQIPPHYLAMVTARFFLQFEFDAIVNVGARSFDEVLSRYERAVAHRCGALFELVPHLTFDRIEESMDSFLRTLPNRVRFQHRILCLSQCVAESVRAAALGSAEVNFDGALRAAVKDALRVRWSGARQRMARAFDAIDLSVLFERRSSTVPDVAEEPVDGGRGFAVVVLANGECPELATVYENAARPVAAVVHVLAPSSQVPLLRQRARSTDIRVHELPVWTIGAVLDVLQRLDEIWFAVLEPGAIVGSSLLDEGEALLRERAGRGAVIPEACVRRIGEYWDLLHFDAIAISEAGAGSLYHGGLQTFGAVFVSAVGVSTELVGRAGTDATAAAFANFAAVAAAERHGLQVARQCLAISPQGASWPEHEWARLLTCPSETRRTSKAPK
jgi:hypothetical protein